MVDTRISSLEDVANYYSTNYLNILFFMNRLDFERLAFRWDCEM